MKKVLLLFIATATTQFAHAQYTFGPQMQSTNTASVTYNSGSNTFQYTDAANSSDDSAHLPLTGIAATFVTTSNDWTASLAANISARTMTATGSESPHAWMALALFFTNGSSTYLLTFSLQQENNTGGANNENFPNGFYGTGATLRGRTNGNDDVTTALGASQLIQGGSVLLLSGATNASPATESISAVTATLTISYNASMKTVTGYCNGTPVGSYSLAGWGASPPLTLLVGGSSGAGIGVPAGTATASNFNVAAQVPYTFEPQVQSTPPASITYDLGTGLFQYTDSATSSDDYAYLPLTGAAAAIISNSNGWTSSINVNLSARSMTDFASAAMGLMVANTNNLGDLAFIFLAQDNNTGGGDDAIYPQGWYGTTARFGANKNGGADVVTRWGSSLASSNGSVYLPFTQATNTSPATESFSSVTGVLTLSYNASMNVLTGYYNGIPVGSYSLAGWGSNPSLALVVYAASGKGVAVPAGTATAGIFFAGLLPLNLPMLAIIRSGANVVLTWPTNAAGFTLQSTTNLVSPAVWTTNLPSPVIANGQNTVSNSVSGPQKFYRLSQ